MEGGVEGGRVEAVGGGRIVGGLRCGGEGGMGGGEGRFGGGKLVHLPTQDAIELQAGGEKIQRLIHLLELRVRAAPAPTSDKTAGLRTRGYMLVLVSDN